MREQRNCTEMDLWWGGRAHNRKPPEYSKLYSFWRDEIWPRLLYQCWHATYEKKKKNEWPSNKHREWAKLHSNSPIQPTDKWNGEKKTRTSTNKTTTFQSPQRYILFVWPFEIMFSKCSSFERKQRCGCWTIGALWTSMLSVLITGDPWPNGQRQASGTAAAVPNEDTKISFSGTAM